jgi:hypothetical protein
LDFFAPGLNEPLRAPIGRSYEPVNVARDVNGDGNWGSSPANIAPLPAPDRPDSFDNRFGNWGSSPADIYLRLRSRRVSSAFPDIAPRNPNQPAPPPEPGPPLGIFSGRPMSPSPLPSSVWGLPDNSDASGNWDWFNFLAGIGSRNPTQPAPSPQAPGSKLARYLGRRIVDQSQASVFDTSAPAVPFVPSDNPNFSGGLLGRVAALAGIDPQNPMQPAPPPLDDGLRGLYRDDPSRGSFRGGARRGTA